MIPIFENNKRYNSLNDELKKTFGKKVYKIALNGGMSCPNRDGTLDINGCIFCSTHGSGDYAPAFNIDIYKQIEDSKKLIEQKYTGNLFIAYFQAFTNTYGSIEYLRKIFFEAIHHPNIVALSIATRPDCLQDDVLLLLQELNTIKPVIIELGLQTIHEETAQFIRRGYALPIFELAIRRLNAINISIVVHVIIGLPSETYEMILQTIKYLSRTSIHGIKLQMLQILKGTDLADIYMHAPFYMFTMEEYINIVVDSLELLPPHIIIHRLTGDPPRRLLIQPLWCQNKRKVLNSIDQLLISRNTWQGKNYIY